MRIVLTLCLIFVLGMVAQAAPTKVASLHPLLSEMASSLGGDKIKVVNLFPENGNLHDFSPTGAEVSAAVGAKLLLACGKGIEPYLGDLKDSLNTKRTRILELGADIPDVMVPDGSRPDPHWWNSPENMKRASRTLLLALCEADPANKATFEANQKKYADNMDRMLSMGKMIMRRIPQEQRVLVTAHAAMCHFCRDFNFTPIPVHGIAMESEGDTASLARLIATLREKQIKCIFTEVNSSPKALDNIARELGIKSRPLVMDGIYPRMNTYEKMFLFNTGIIASGLAPAKKKNAEQAK